MQTTKGDMAFEFAFDNWVMIAWQSRTVQRQCRSRKELARGLVEIGLPVSEAESVAEQAWSKRPLDASTADSASLVRSIGNQWLVGAVLIAFLVGLTLALLIALRGLHQ